MENIKSCIETGCYVCATKSHFHLMYYLGYFPLKLQCAPEKPQKEKKAFSVHYDKTGFMISFAHHIILIQFLIASIYEILNLPDGSHDLVIILKYLDSMFIIGALVCLHWTVHHTPNQKLEIEGLAKIGEAHFLLRPMYTKVTKERINYDTYLFALVLLIIIPGCNFIEIFYNWIYDLNVTMGEVYFCLSKVYISWHVWSKFYMAFAVVQWYGYFLDEHHDYLKYKILEPKRTPKSYNMEEETDDTITTLSDYVDTENRTHNGRFVFVKSAESYYDIRLKMIPMRKLYSAIFSNLVFMNDSYNPQLLLGFFYVMGYGTAMVFTFSGILVEGYTVDLLITRVISFTLLVGLCSYLILSLNFLYNKVNFDLMADAFKT